MNNKPIWEQRKDKDEVDANAFWDNLSYEDKCKAFYAVSTKMYQGEMLDGGTYRHVLYGIFGFGPEMYEKGMNAGYFSLHNAMWNDDVNSKNILSYCIERIDDLKGYSGVGEDGNPYDTTSWNAALVAVQQMLKERKSGN